MFEEVNWATVFVVANVQLIVFIVASVLVFKRTSLFGIHDSFNRYDCSKRSSGCKCNKQWTSSLVREMVAAELADRQISLVLDNDASESETESETDSGSEETESGSEETESSSEESDHSDEWTDEDESEWTDIDDDDNEEDYSDDDSETDTDDSETGSETGSEDLDSPRDRLNLIMEGLKIANNDLQCVLKKNNMILLTMKKSFSETQPVKPEPNAESSAESSAEPPAEPNAPISEELKNEALEIDNI